MSSAARLLSVAERLAEACPPELGREIAATGSVGSGLADEHSDLELLFLVESVPEAAAVVRWLTSIGATDVLCGRDTFGTWGWCRVDGVECEPSWAGVERIRREVDAITSGDVLEHGRLALGHVVAHARVLRTEGVLSDLAAKVASYPEELRPRLVADAVAGWEIPSPRLGAALRGDRLPLEAFLLDDAARVLRVVFALNRRWELPSRWKWLAAYAGTLEIAPEHLARRVAGALVATDALAAVASMLELIRETLDLVPADLDVRAAREGTKRRLAAVGRAR